MFTLSVIIYVIFAILTGPMWPLELIGGKAGPIGYLLVLVWVGLLIGGL